MVMVCRLLGGGGWPRASGEGACELFRGEEEGRVGSDAVRTGLLEEASGRLEPVLEASCDDWVAVGAR